MDKRRAGFEDKINKLADAGKAMQLRNQYRTILKQLQEFDHFVKWPALSQSFQSDAQYIRDTLQRIGHPIERQHAELSGPVYAKSVSNSKVIKVVV